MALNLVKRMCMNPNSRALYTGYVCRTESKESGVSTPKAKPAPPATPAKDPPTDPTIYNATEYFSYSEYSYYDIDRECISMRIKQPEAPMQHR